MYFLTPWNILILFNVLGFRIISRLSRQTFVVIFDTNMKLVFICPLHLTLMKAVSYFQNKIASIWEPRKYSFINYINKYWLNFTQFASSFISEAGTNVIKTFERLESELKWKLHK